MLSTEKLEEFGADTRTGISRCMGNEDFYLMLVKKAVGDNRLPLLRKAIEENDLKGAFENAHALKGMYANLSLTPLLAPVSEMTELLRAGTRTDYFPLLEEAEKQFERLCSL
ncbi:MAG: Hpt domain-containing protein [Oscillospiraceae bacterium]|nr:Hpt domain-containing protein [Oscillospiraceae bacterium]